MGIVIGAAIINDGRILLVRNEQSWVLPDGKPESGESDIECLCREVSEKLSGTQLDNIRYYGVFEGRTPNTRDVLMAKVYFADIKGELHQPTAEIAAYDWVEDPSQYNLSDITSKIVYFLTRDEYLRHPND